MKWKQFADCSSTLLNNKFLCLLHFSIRKICIFCVYFDSNTVVEMGIGSVKQKKEVQHCITQFISKANEGCISTPQEQLECADEHPAARDEFEEQKIKNT